VVATYPPRGGAVETGSKNVCTAYILQTEDRIVTTKTPPKYCRQRQKNRPDQAFMRIGSRKHWLGVYGSDESHERYHKLIAEWRAGGGKPLVVEADIAIVELAARYLEHVDRRYGAKPEATHYKNAVRHVVSMYGSLRASEFSPKKLKLVRERMLQNKIGKAKRTPSRRYINDQVARVKRMLRWAVAEELVDAEVLRTIECVEPLCAGETEALEGRKVQPVDDTHVDAIKPFVSRQIWAIIEVQRHSAARGTEVLTMRPVDIDMTHDVWLYRPVDHKNKHRGKDRLIHLGPKCQEAIKPFLVNRPVDAYLFSPVEAVNEQQAEAKSRRRPGQRATPRKTSRRVGPRYTRSSYRVAIQRACDIADRQARQEAVEAGGSDPGRMVPRWHPHQLRHSGATKAREVCDLETASAVMGSTVEAGQIYAQRNQSLAREYARNFG